MGLFKDFIKAYNEIKASENQPKAPSEYGGVPMSELNTLASTIRSGRVKTDGTYLYFDFKSRSGRYGNTIKFRIYNNKLSKMVNRYYPNQSYFPEDDFMNKANEQFYFIEE
jgi:hypothetical protein